MGDLKSLEPSAPDLHDYGSYAWVRGLLEKPDAPEYFGHTPQCDGMTTWKENTKLDAKGLDEVAAFVATFASIPPDTTPAEWLADPKVKDHPGRRAYQKECAECHTMGDPSILDKMMQPAPDLFAWGSPRWTARMIKSPGSTPHYGYLEAEQKMPSFGGQLTDPDIATLVRYLRGDYEEADHRPKSAGRVTAASP
jgi:ubiquinol-cytochrome c reductase cytochrome b subunit